MQTRGMKKWRPFATMPEQYIGLQEVINKQLEVPKPLLTEEQMEQMNFTLIEALHTNKQVYLTYYKKGQCITETGFIQFVDSLGDLFIFIDDVFELKNKLRLSELLDLHFCFIKKRATQMSSFSKNTHLR
ncbi:YolD-like family protein [Priestia megaterium]|uniref:YolD-like family protein n=1 Tax=Priestia megaterium TaxID=1404 RepID=UPI00101DCACD|nr:YolD-like family protein [Priestia megaterium]